MGGGLKRSLTKMLHRLEHHQEPYGSTLPEVLTVRSATSGSSLGGGAAWPAGRKAMISFSGSLKIFLLVDCCDMRKGFNGPYGLVSSSFGDDPRNGALYVFL
jgi:transposase